MNITDDLVKSLISKQFPQFAHLNIESVDIQGHDNRTYRLGDTMCIRLPTAECYALKIPIEQEFLPLLAKHLTIAIPKPLHIGLPSNIFPYAFSIYEWLNGVSLNYIDLQKIDLNILAYDLAKFLKELHMINTNNGLKPGLHNWYRGDHVSIYDEGARKQITALKDIINSEKALYTWQEACATKWNKKPVWIHGDFAIGNILMNEYKLSAVIDFGGCAIGDPACDLVIAWTLFTGQSREIFIQEMNLDADTWLRAKAWALWKSTFELCNTENKYSEKSEFQKKIIHEIIISSLHL